MKPDNACRRKTKQCRQPIGITAPQAEENENSRIRHQHRKGVGADINGLENDNGMQTKHDGSDESKIAFEKLASGKVKQIDRAQHSENRRNSKGDLAGPDDFG